MRSLGKTALVLALLGGAIFGGMLLLILLLCWFEGDCSLGAAYLLGYTLVVCLTLETLALILGRIAATTVAGRSAVKIALGLSILFLLLLSRFRGLSPVCRPTPGKEAVTGSSRLPVSFPA